MARPRLEIGEHGNIVTLKQPDGRYLARARFRGIDGKLRDVEAIGATRPKAERALKARVRERVGDRDSELGGDTRLKVLAAKWWETIERKCRAGELNADTRREYLRYRDYVIDACGDLALRECTVGRLETAVLEAAGDHKRTGSEMKRTLVGMFDYAVRMNAVDHNPAKDIDAGRVRGKKPRALTLPELEDMRARIHAYETSGGPNAPRAAGKAAGGRPRAVYLLDVFNLQLALGCRIGEVLALQWEDIDGLDGDRVVVSIAGTLKHRSGAEAERLGLPAGLYRQDHPKTEAGIRDVVLPEFAVTILRRLHRDRDETVPWVIATSKGTPRNPSNVRTALRKARGEEYEWVTPHTLRRTTATTIAETTGSAQAASLVLGHASTAITELYIDRTKLAGDMSAVVQSLAPKVTYLSQSAG